MRSAIIIITIVILINGTVFAQANISASDKEQIINNLEELVRAINTSNKEVIIGLISADNPELKYNIKERIGDDIKYQLDYRPFDKNLEIITQDQVRIKARFAASGMSWAVSGLSAYFIFEKQNDQWFITDTDFHKKLGPDYVLEKIGHTLGTMGKVFMIVGPICLLLFIFWLWMLIDCIERDFDNKALWIILLIVINGIAAILYFFIVKRKDVTKKPLKFKAFHYSLTVFKKYAVFSGRASRAEYWSFYLVNSLVLSAFSIALIVFTIQMFGSVITSMEAGPGDINVPGWIYVLLILGGIYALAFFIPSIAVGVRRMHDVNKSGWFIFVPIYNIVLAATDGTKGDNQYGPDPKTEVTHSQLNVSK